MVVPVSAADLDTTIVGVLGANAKFGGGDIDGDDGGVEVVEGLEGGYFHGNIIFGLRSPRYLQLFPRKLLKRLELRSWAGEIGGNRSPFKSQYYTPP